MADQRSYAIWGASHSWKHSLIECNMDRCVWVREEEEIVEHLCLVQKIGARDWLMSLLKSPDHKKIVKVVVRLWAIWYTRRKAIHENIFQS